MVDVLIVRQCRKTWAQSKKACTQLKKKCASIKCLPLKSKNRQELYEDYESRVYEKSCIDEYEGRVNEKSCEEKKP